MLLGKSGIGDLGGWDLLGHVGFRPGDVAGLGRIEIKAMGEAGYDAPFSAAVTAASGVIGPVIPPSIPLVVYGAIAEESIGKLLLAGAPKMPMDPAP